MQTIKCLTLFDITNTGVVSRKPPNNLTDEEKVIWNTKKLSQANFDTILQVISLRTQPENITKPQNFEISFDGNEKFGFLFENEEPQQCWKFTFTISFNNVYNDGIKELGHLYDDCHGVPMLKTGVEWKKLPLFLDSSPELRNIYFEVLNDE